MWVQHVQYIGNTIRGFVADGHFWMDFNNETREMRVCIVQSCDIQWDEPINILRNVPVKCIITVPATLGLTEHTDVVAWATKEMEIQYG